MTDNVNVLPSTDPNAVPMRTDEIAGIHHPAYKQMFGDAGEATFVSRTNPLPVILGSEASQDAFGRLRTSDPETIFDSKQIFDNAPLFWDDQEVSGTGTSSTHDVNEAMTRMLVSATTAGKRVRQTFMRFNYQPGKSHQVFMTGVLDGSGGGTGITRRIGIFDDNNGLFVEDDAGTIKFVRRTKTSGSVVDNKTTIPTTFTDGTVIDWAKTQILVIDFEWLGVGRVRFGLVKDGMIDYLHSEDGSNTLTLAYMSTPNLPLRYSIDNDGNGAASQLCHICSTVITEGGTTELGILFHQSTAGTQIDMDTEGTIYAIVGFRLKSTHLGATIKIVKAAVTLQSAGDDIEWILIHDPTIGGTPSWQNKANSALQYFIGGATNTITGGAHMNADYVSTGSGQSGASPSTSEIRNALRLGAAIDNTPQTVVLAARPINGSATNVFAEGGLTWRELV